MAHAQKAFWRGWAHPAALPAVNGMICSLCALLEGSFGWVVGSAWTKAVSSIWETPNMFPSLLLFFEDLAKASLFTGLAVVWFISIAEDPSKYDDDQKSHRSAIERFFLTNAFSFAVGWMYISWMRDLVRV